MKPTTLTCPRAIFALLVIAYLVYAGAFIWTTSAVVEADDVIPDTRRYFVLFDDMMISMRYAKNLANGDGLVWNPGGERVEGFTNPAWVGYMALFHWFGLPEPTISAAIQASGAVFMALTLLVVGHIAARLSANPWAGVIAAAFTAFYLPLNTWSLQGTEVSALTLITALAVLATLRALDTARFSVLPYLLLGFGTLVRVDMAVPFGAVAAFLFLTDRDHRWRHALAAPLILAGFLAPQFAFRRWYYGEWLPNTYYLKMQGYPTGRRIQHGLEIATRFVMRTGVLPFGVFVFRRDRGVALLAWIFAGQMAYNVYVGGDAWEHYGGANRYLSIAMPLLFVLLALTLTEVYAWLARIADSSGRAYGDTPPRESGADEITRRGALWGVGILTLALFLGVNYTYGTGAWQEALLLKPSLYADENGDKIAQALWLDALTTPDATIALSGAGIVPYFSERAYIDLLGKNDPVIARLPMDRTVIPELKPGHMKWDYAYSIGELRPDVVLELWVQPETAGPLLDASYLPVWFPPKNANVWMRDESPNVRWVRIFGE